MSRPREVASPDGGRWNGDDGRSHRSWSKARKEPFFWAHVLGSGFLALMLFISMDSEWPLQSAVIVFVPIVFVMWLIGFVSSSRRPTIRAETAGPPPDHREWTVERRFHAARSVRDVVAAIARGEPSAEPPGTRLTAI